MEAQLSPKEDAINQQDNANGHEEKTEAVATECPTLPVETAGKEEKTGEEFKYLQRKEFTSEIYKIELRGLKYFGVAELKKLLKNKCQLDATKVKSPNRGKGFAFICFRTAEDYERALQILNGYKWKGKVLQATAANASPDPLVMKRRIRNEKEEGSGKKKAHTSIEATCPLAHLSYDEQIIQKQEGMENLLKKFKNELKRVNVGLKLMVEKLEFLAVTKSPKINGYRNKNEFSIGRNSNGEMVVGFRLGSYSDGSTEVSDLHSNPLPHLPDAAKWAANTFQEFLRNHAVSLELVPFNPEANSGHFRQLMVRTSEKTDEIMLVVGMYSSNLSAEQVESLKNLLKIYYTEELVNENSKYRVTSLFYQDVKNREVGQMINPVEHLSGTKHITDEILNLRFRISPLAFFQVNTLGAYELYQHAIDLATPKPNSYMLDICCGTGTIALAFAKHVRRVLGVDIVEDAINDAKLNAQDNNITNVRFYAGNADDYISSLVREATYDCAPNEQLDLFAVIDPPRNGLHTRSITAIRAATEIKRLVYISCNPNRALRNWIDLCRPESKQYKGEAFYPSKAVAVDMFPHTMHTELIMLFERTEQQAANSKE